MLNYKTLHKKKLINRPYFLIVTRLIFITPLLILLLVTPATLAAEKTEKKQNSGDKSASKEMASTLEKAPATDVGKNDNTLSPPISISEQSKADLQHYLSEDEITPILAGPDEYLTIISKNKYKHSKGVVVLLPDWQQSIVSNNAINYLRNALTHQGWNTIAIQPNDRLNEDTINTSMSSEEQQKTNKAAMDRYKEKLSTLMKTVISKARDYPGIFIVIAQGNHGAMLVDLYQQGKNRAPSGLILLSSYAHSNATLRDKENMAFANMLAQSSYPVLDLYLTFDHHIVNNKVAQRLSMAEKEMKIYYRQRQITNTSSGKYPEDALLRQINRWLKSIGW